jgi:MFS family permease
MLLLIGHISYLTSSENILGAFFYGYIVTQLPGGWLATRYGGKWVFGIGVLGTAALTLLTPVVAEFSSVALFILRVVEGFMEVWHITYVCRLVMCCMAGGDIPCYICDLGTMGTAL